MPEPRLFRLAVEAVAISAVHKGGEGWSLRIMKRRGDESWANAFKMTYDRLSSAELIDVLCAEAENLL